MLMRIKIFRLGEIVTCSRSEQDYPNTPTQEHSEQCRSSSLAYHRHPIQVAFSFIHCPLNMVPIQSWPERSILSVMFLSYVSHYNMSTRFVINICIFFSVSQNISPHLVSFGVCSHLDFGYFDPDQNRK